MEKQKNIINWEIHQRPEETIEIIGSLEEALRSNDSEAVQKILQKPENLRSLVQRRGDDSQNHDLIAKSFEAMFQEKFGLSDIYHRQGKEVIDFIQEYDLPEQLLVEYLDVAFHKRDKALLNRLATIIFENEEMLKNKSIVAGTLHNLASWKASVDKNPQEALNYNKRALALARETGDDKLVEKIKYGLTFAKDLKPRDKIKGMEEVVFGMEALNHDYDAMKARVDEALAHIDLAKLQKRSKQLSERKDHLDMALELIGKAYNYSVLKKISNLEVMALDAFSKVYAEMGDDQKAKRNKGKAERARQKYGYLTRRD